MEVVDALEREEVGVIAVVTEGSDGANEFSTLLGSPSPRLVVVLPQSVNLCALPAGDAGGLLSEASMANKFKDKDLGENADFLIFESVGELPSSTAANHAVVGDGCLR